MNRRAAFTLPELLTVLGIVSILIGLSLPAIQQARAAAQRLSCLSRLRQVALAIHGYHDLNNSLPPKPIRDPRSPRINRLWWYVHITPQLEREDIWLAALAAITEDPIPYHNPPHEGIAGTLPPLVCPSDGRLLTPQRDPDARLLGFVSYVGVEGGSDADGPFGRAGIRLTDMIDGASQTILIGERPPPDSFQAGEWYSNWHPSGRLGFNYGPNGRLSVQDTSTIHDPCGGPFRFGPGTTANPCDRHHFWSFHPGGANFALADGSARTFTYGSHTTLMKMATIAGGETVDLD